MDKEYTIKLTEEELQTVLKALTYGRIDSKNDKEEVLAFARLEDKLRIATGKSW